MSPPFLCTAAPRHPTPSPLLLGHNAPVFRLQWPRSPNPTPLVSPRAACFSLSVFFLVKLPANPTARSP